MMISSYTKIYEKCFIRLISNYRTWFDERHRNDNADSENVMLYGPEIGTAKMVPPCITLKIDRADDWVLNCCLNKLMVESSKPNLYICITNDTINYRDVILNCSGCLK